MRNFKMLCCVCALAVGACSSDSPGSGDPGGADGGGSNGSPDAGGGGDGGGGGSPDGGGGGAIRDPESAGPTTWHDGSETITVDGESIPLTLFVPDAAGAHPAVVLTHGFMLDPSLYTSYGEHLASWGYLVVMPKMPGDLFNTKSHRQLADYLTGVIDWLETANDDTGADLYGAVDTDRIALAGHSMGGKLSLLVASEDDRPRAVFGIDPVDASPPTGGDPAAYPSVTPERMPDIDVPLALLGETVNASGGLGQPCAPAADNFQQYYTAAVSPAIQIEVLGANHMSFLDDPNCGLTCSVCSAGTDDPAVTRALTRGYMTAFFELTLRGDDRYATYVTGAEMEADVFAGKVNFAHKNGL